MKKENLNTSIKHNGMEFFSVKLTNEVQIDPNYKYIRGRNQWIDFGPDNLTPQKLINLSENSPTHQSLLFLKQCMTYGGGLDYNKDNISLHNFIYKTDLNEVMDRAIEDLIMFNGYSLDIGFNDEGDYIADVSHFDFSTVRLENEIKPKWTFLNSDWANHSKNEMVKLPMFNPENSLEQPNQILYNVEYNPGLNYYPKPDYKCIKFINFEILLGEFIEANILNGMAPSGIFSFKEIPTKEEREIIKRNIKRDFTGPQSSGKFIALFSESKEKAVEFIPIKNDNNNNIYGDLNQLAVQKIISAHHLNNPSVAGLPSAGGISFGNELATSYEYFYTQVIKKYQNRILKSIRKILMFNKLIQDPSEIGIKDTQPYQYRFDSNIIGNSVTVNEIRKSMGLPAIEGGDTLLFKNGATVIPQNNTVNHITQLPPTTNQAPTLNNNL